jgi:UDP-GlcNAc:undecaprenyl-phosphate GlcNAc-1-phosphate transferase
MLNNLFIILIIQLFVLFLLNKVSYKIDFLDYPNKRKVHSTPTPFIGGLSLGLSYCVVVFITDINFLYLNFIFAYALIVSIFGLVDDKFNISPTSKIILQSIPVYILISKGLYLTNIGDYEIIGKINLGGYGEIFTFFCCLLIMNAFNYSDGVDGLLSTLFINIFINFLIICYVFNEIYIGQILIYFIFPVLIFLLFNLSLLKLPKIFLGDSGSTLLGFLTGFVMIFLYEKVSIKPSILIWPVALIIYEFISTNLVRIFKKKKIFQSGNDHIHYQISKKYNLKVLGINLTMNLVNCIITFSGLLIYYLFGSLFSLIGFIIFFFIYLRIKFSFFINVF